MRTLVAMLDPNEVETLRRAYDSQQLLDTNSNSFANLYPPFAAWQQTVGTLFFGSEPLSARERELCLVALLAQTPGPSLATHVYWGLMEGLTIDQIMHAVGLSSCYGGLPVLTRGMFIIQKTLGVLKKVAAAGDCAPSAVMTALIAEFVGSSV